ncbi:MAG TPA: hypothetical protein VG318_04525 [Actinomycetota bacterium]|nr:hypothetical protein [Actinomycetota bacterium]
MRLRAAVVVALVLSAAVTAPAGAGKARRAMKPYSLEDTNHHFGGPGAGFGVWDTRDAYEFELKKGENAVAVMVLDDRESAVSGVVVQWTTDFESGGASVGHAITSHHFCTTTDGPVPVVPDVPVEIIIRKGTCEDGTPSTPIEGDIVVDFHKT